MIQYKCNTKGGKMTPWDHLPQEKQEEIKEKLIKVVKEALEELRTEEKDTEKKKDKDKKDS